MKKVLTWTTGIAIGLVSVALVGCSPAAEKKTDAPAEPKRTGAESAAVEAPVPSVTPDHPDHPETDKPKDHPAH